MLIISPTLKIVIYRTVPLVAGLFSIMFVQLVDSVFIGQLGVNQLAVHGMTLPFQTVLIGIQVGIGVAATCIMSEATGAKQVDRSATMATLSVAFGVVFISLFCLILFGAGDKVFALFVSTDTTAQQLSLLQYTFDRYWPVWLLSSIAVAALYLTTCVYRANEDTKTTGTMFVVASVINLILDPIFIFHLEMGIEGAAFASIAGYSSSTLYMLVNTRGKRWFKSVFCCRINYSYLFELIRLAIPTTANQILPSVSALLSMMLISRLGTDAIAFWSLLMRVESFLLVFTLALTMSVPPMIGHYLGAGKQDEIHGLLLTSAKFLFAFHLCIALLFMIGAEYFVDLISEDSTIKSWLSTALWVIPFSYGPLGLCMVIVSAFNALGAPKKALFISFVRLFLLYIPAIWLGSFTDNVVSTVIMATVANMMAGAFAWFKLQGYFKLNTPYSLSARI